MRPGVYGKEAFFDELNKRDAAAYSEVFQDIRSEMDGWFYGIPRRSGIFQHRLIKSKQGRLTILDIEYAVQDEGDHAKIIDNLLSRIRE